MKTISLPDCSSGSLRALALTVLAMTFVYVGSPANAQTVYARGGAFLADGAGGGGAPISGQFGARLDYLGFLKLDGSVRFDNHVPGVGADAAFSTTALEASALVFPLENEAGLNPYGYIGLGRYLTTSGNDTFAPRSVVPMGVGVEYPLMGGFALNADIGMRWNLNRNEEPFASELTTGISPTIGITYNIARAQQIHRDGGHDPIFALFDRSGTDEPAEEITEEPAVAEAQEPSPAVDTTQTRSRAAGGVPGPATEAPHAVQTGEMETWNDMVRLPDGTFIMGLTDEDPLSLQTAGRKRVTVSSFFLDRYAVSNRDYREYLDELSPDQREAALPDSTVWAETGNRYSWGEYFRGSAYADFPVIAVTHEQAQNYCEFYDKRLATEAEWEYAARADQVGGIYPWVGFEPRDRQGRYLANYNPGRGGYAADGYAFTAPVDEYPPNPWGLYNMSGNVAEWVADAFTNTYADISDFNPLYEDDDEPRRVVRGGSWASDAFDIGVGVRDTQRYDEATPYTGFRCAMDISDVNMRQAEENDE